MAKDKHPEPKPATAGERVPAPTPLPVERHGPTDGDAAGTRPDGSGRGLVEQVGSAATETARLVHAVLPNRTPAYLGAGALLLTGVIDLPAAVAGGLVYEALRRWTPG
ncbi:hypothetical protein LQ327_29760 [Actinomycetospora endophytica]|uniref:Uncharacterized protein n=2 Tax=Actinomycetospora endophytica TaxID=2291215 RepID=A0ABS8PH18_9PSEU|nr:hypothetical protein [Actinomycetospora endophytica]